MMRKLLTLLGAALAVFIISLGLRHYILSPSGNVSAFSTQALFEATYPDASGKVQAVNQWRGKLAVVNFWATWCPPCREEMPELSQLQDQYGERGVVVLGISTDDVAKIHEFNAETKVSYPLLAGTDEAMNVAASLGNDKGVLPYTVIIKPDGTILKTYFGRVNKLLLEQTLLPLLTTQ
jgi:peroxiredoxin